MIADTDTTSNPRNDKIIKDYLERELSDKKQEFDIESFEKSLKKSLNEAREDERKKIVDDLENGIEPEGYSMRGLKGFRETIKRQTAEEIFKEIEKEITNSQWNRLDYPRFRIVGFEDRPEYQRFVLKIIQELKSKFGEGK